mgnify:CR=1 FL=1
MDEVTAAPRRKRTAAQRFRDFLAREGFRPWFEDELPGCIWFNFEGYRYLVRLEDGDDDYVQVALGYLLEEDCRDELALLRAMNVIQAETKVVKIFLGPRLEFVEFQMELFLDGHPMSLDLLQRCLLVLRGTSRAYLDRVQPETPKARA